MTSKLLFDGKVCVITGAGRGLGRAYALELAQRGARIVVNDLGCEADGEGKTDHVAYDVIKEITAGGGKAIAHFGDVSDPGSAGDMIETALSTFGGIDILVNNAGYGVGELLNDMSVSKYTHIDAVNHLGSVWTTKAAWPFMKEKKYGRIIMTSSPAGVWGRLGISAYSAAKAAIVTLTRVLAEEGQADNIKVNAVAPLAFSRLSRMFDSELGRRIMRPELVAPLVVALAHDTCPISGQTIKAAGGRFSCVKVIESKGVAFDPREDLEAEKLTGRFEDMCNMADGGIYDNSAEAFLAGFEALEEIIGDDARQILETAMKNLKKYD